MLVITRIRNTT